MEAIEQKALRLLRAEPGLTGEALMAKLGKGIRYNLIMDMEDKGLIVWNEVGWYVKERKKKK